MADSLTVAVLGGTGSFGREATRQLTAAGHRTIALSRNPPASPVPGVEHRVADVTTGAGLDGALDDVDAVVEATNAQKAPRSVLIEGTTDLIRRCRESGVDHFVGISIIGCESANFGYYRAKTEQEKLIQSAPIGWSLIKATQFHELLNMAFTAMGRRRLSPRGPFPLQPIAAAEVAGRLVAIVESGPLDRVERIAGPEVSDLSTLAKTWQAESGRRNLPLRVFLPGKTGRALRDGALTDPEAATPGPSFDEWLAARRTS